VEIRLWMRRFFCDVEGCAYRIFTEQLPETTATYARHTLRMEQALRWLALALGREAGVAHRKAGACAEAARVGAPTRCRSQIVSICCVISAKRWSTSWHVIPRCSN
jgi:hypothetical protein